MGIVVLLLPSVSVVISELVKVALDVAGITSLDAEESVLVVWASASVAVVVVVVVSPGAVVVVMKVVGGGAVVVVDVVVVVSSWVVEVMPVIATGHEPLSVSLDSITTTVSLPGLLGLVGWTTSLVVSLVMGVIWLFHTDWLRAPWALLLPL